MPDSPPVNDPTITESGASASLQVFSQSQTFLARSPVPQVIILRIAAVVSLLAFFFIMIPALNLSGWVDDYKVNVLGKYLSLTIVALGIDLIWGYTGILSLGQAIFFCMGAYVMSMHLSLPQGGGDVRPEYHNIPQFMFFNNIRTLPIFWQPFQWMPFTILAGLIIPAVAASVFGFFVFRSRVRGVYFSIVTQAVAWGSWLLISRNEMLLGGTNGLTNFYKPLTESRRWILGLYLTTLTTLVLAYLLCRAIARSRLGRVLIAVRDKETRLYFAGYRPYTFKVFSFTVAAVLAAVGGMLYAPQVTVVTPQNMSIKASLDMVIWVAIGGRGKLWGAIFGALLVNYFENSLGSDLPQLWPFVEGAMFISVVLLFPDGIVGLWDGIERRLNGGQSLSHIAAPLAAILTITLWIICQSLGLMPRFLLNDFYKSESVGDLQWKYVVLVFVLGMCGLWQFARDRAAQGRTLVVHGE
jgi:urea transport system permease protein